MSEKLSDLKKEEFVKKLIEHRKKELNEKAKEQKKSNSIKDVDVDKIIKKSKELLEESKKHISIDKQSNSIEVESSQTSDVAKTAKKYKLRNAILKKTKIFKKPGKLAKKLLYYTLAGSTLLFWGGQAVEYGINKVESAQVDKAVDFYGGADVYFGKSIFGPYVEFKTSDTKNIKFGVDKSTDEKTKQQLNFCIDYINSVFDVINPNYHLNTVDVDNNKDCDIYFSVSNFAIDYPNILSNTMAITKNRKSDNIFDLYNYKHADIYYNTKYLENAYIRCTMLHEIVMHCLLGNNDLSYDETQQYHHYNVPFSVLSYKHSTNMILTLKYYELYNKGEKKDKEYLEYLQNEFTTIAPFDVIALASRYGNLNDERNKKDCVKLIIDTYRKCYEVFGENKYFLDTVELNKEGYPAKYDLYVAKRNPQKNAIKKSDYILDLNNLKSNTKKYKFDEEETM